MKVIPETRLNWISVLSLPFIMSYLVKIYTMFFFLPVSIEDL
jgi:ABC-type spermidine/putrescine transport system permease subunit I